MQGGGRSVEYGMPGIRENDAIVPSREDAFSQIVLQLANMLADGRGGDTNLLGGGNKAAGPGGGFEGAQRVEGWKGERNIWIPSCRLLGALGSPDDIDLRGIAS